jgi:hypothetical protein
MPLQNTRRTAVRDLQVSSPTVSFFQADIEALKPKENEYFCYSYVRKSLLCCGSNLNLRTRIISKL